MEEPTVQLGFAVPIEDLSRVGHRSPNFDGWDGGQLGGHPTWLDPEHLPKPLACEHCQRTLRFVCQFYAPIDEFTDGGDDPRTEIANRGYHRSFYVYGCPECSESNTGSIRVLRAQLTQSNAYWPLECDDLDASAWTQHLPSTQEAKQCEVCRFRSQGRCSVQEVEFCGKDHQREHKKCVHTPRSKGEPEKPLPSVYPIYELVVEEEPEPQSTAPSTEHEIADGDDSDQEIEQDDLNLMSNRKNADTTSQDTQTISFYDRIRNRPNVAEQVLRYCRWEGDGPLWIRSSEQPTTIPPCPLCGGARKFEFQLMPQMLHYLLKDRAKVTTRDFSPVKPALLQADAWVEEAPKHAVPPKLVDAREEARSRIRDELAGEKELDWGVVCVFTCTKSCDALEGENAYLEEFAWRQHSLDL